MLSIIVEVDLSTILKVLRQRTTPITVAACDDMALERKSDDETQTDAKTAVTAKPSRTSITVAEKCELLNMLRLGKSYKEAKLVFKERTGKTVGARSLARLANKFVLGMEKSGLLRIEDKRATRSGRWNSPQGKFTDTLVDHLDDNFRSRNGLSHFQQWVFWDIQEIRFELVFGVLPVRVALMCPDFDEGDATPGVPTSGHRHDWRDWHIEQIRNHVGKTGPRADVMDLIERMKIRFPLSKPYPFTGRLKFCERSVLKALKIGGYVESHAVTRGIDGRMWVRIDANIEGDDQPEPDAAAEQDVPSPAQETENAPMPDELVAQEPD